MLRLVPYLTGLLLALVALAALSLTGCGACGWVTVCEGIHCSCVGPMD